VELNDVELTIKRDQPRVLASASIVVAGNEQKLRLMGDLASTTGMCLKETLIKAEFFGQTTELPGAVPSLPMVYVLLYRQ
jgi:hypothetical protein